MTPLCPFVRDHFELFVAQMQHTSDAQDIDTLIQEVFAAAYSLLGCQRVAMFMVDDMRQELYCVASPDAKNFTIPWDRVRHQPTMRTALSAFLWC